MNSAYGSLLQKPAHYQNVKYVKSEHGDLKLANDPLFSQLTEWDCVDEFYEVQMYKKVHNHTFLYGIKGQCMNGKVKEFDNKYRWCSRTCCKKCNIVHSRQPAIFHIEWTSSTPGDKCVGLASKLYIVQL